MAVEFHNGPASGSAEDQRTAGPWPDAGQQMYETLAAPLFDYCVGLLEDEVAASDAVQDSLIAVDAQILRQPEPDQLRASLYFAARRQCRSRRPGRRVKPADPPGPAAVPAAVPDVTASRTPAETLSIVTAALARLPESDREVLSLAYRHGIEGARLAAVLGLSPRRAESLLSGAGTRFGQSAAVVVILRAGEAGCQVLEGIVSQQDAVAAPLDSKLIRLNRHTESCADCARVVGDQAFSPDLISQVPLIRPAGRLRLRIIRTTLALGAYRRRAAGGPDGSASGTPESPASGAQRA